MKDSNESERGSPPNTRLAAVTEIPRPKEEILGLLADLLNEARRGEILSIAVACEFTDGTCRNDFGVDAGGGWQVLLGQVSMLQREIQDHLIGRREES
jgi:hypothetical protein